MSTLDDDGTWLRYTIDITCLAYLMVDALVMVQIMVQFDVQVDVHGLTHDMI
jgi:hypothetical protein